MSDMTQGRDHVKRNLGGYVSATLDLPVQSVERLTGGSKKGVYRLRGSDGGSVIAYVWATFEDYWPTAEPMGDRDLFWHATGLDRFTEAHRLLTDLAVPTPAVFAIDTSHADLDADIALIEDAPNGTLEEHLDTARSVDLLSSLNSSIQRMHLRRGAGAGPVGTRLHTEAGVCERFLLDRALQDLTYAASRIPELNDAATDIEDRLRSGHRSVQPRQDYRLIHGELGPDHVLIDRDGNPTLIDIEGLMFFDIEWEHVFLELRFAGSYAALADRDLDPCRMALYRQCLYLSLCAGPLRLLTADYPDRHAMFDIIKANTRRVLAQFKA